MVSIAMLPLIYLQPYGVIPLDASKMWGAATLSIQYVTDLFTGDSVLRIFTNGKQLVHETTAKLGVSVQLSNINFGIPSGSGGLLQTGIAAAFGGLQAALSGGTLSDVGNGILNAAQATNADVASKGATGSTIAFDMAPYMVARLKLSRTITTRTTAGPCASVCSCPRFRASSWWTTRTLHYRRRPQRSTASKVFCVMDSF